jgi:hypothetical protein
MRLGHGKRMAQGPDDFRGSAANPFTIILSY